MPSPLPRPLMHPGQLTPTAGDVAALIAAQFPPWAGLPVRAVPSGGTVSALFRVGDELVARLPLQPAEVDAARRGFEAEAVAGRRLRSAQLPVPTPDPVAIGAPGNGFPLPWSVWTWLPGTVATSVDVSGSAEIASDLGRFGCSVRALDTGGATFTGAGRGGRLTDHDAAVAGYLADARGMIDTAAVAALWAALRRTPRDGAPDTWTHGDLMPGNLLITRDRLAGVIDVGGAGVADPALDLQPAWNLLDATARAVFREAVDVDDDTWRRGQAWALVQAVGTLAYYRVTNPLMSRTGTRTLTALLDDCG